LLEQGHKLEPFDFVYERYSLWSLAGRTFSNKHRLPFVLEVNSPLRMEQKKYRHLHLDTLASQIEQVLFHQSDWIVTVSSAVSQYVLETSHRTQPILLLPNGVDLDLFRSVGGTPEDGSFTIGFVGSLKPWHGVEVLFEAFRLLAVESDVYRLLVVGDGPLGSWIQKFVGQYGLKARVSCVGGVEKRRIPELLSRMHVAVAPYPRLDNFYFSPLKIFEYMAAGRAIVASRIGQLADILRDEETALLAEAGSITDLVEKIRRLRVEPGIRLSLGRSAKAEAFRKHGWSNRVQDLIDAIAIGGTEAGRLVSAFPRTSLGGGMRRDLIASLGTAAADGS
jgi:glycosyltransferase involved in cell wall biosynthesis